MFRRAIWPSCATAHETVHYLASACDGAIRRDGHGFGQDHVALGHWLAQIPAEQWNAQHQHAALWLVRIYRRQLDRAGFDTNAILRQRPRRRRRRALRELAPGWAPDPTGLWAWRWWNGVRWTEHVAR